MKISLNWLKEYVEIQMPPRELGKLLTMTGLEVEGIELVGQGLQDVIVSRIAEVKPHQRSDHLSVCQVDTGKEIIPVVCGASNAEVNALVPLALPGFSLPDGMIINETRIRGELSKGMLLAEDEIGLTDDHSGIMILPSDLVPGTSLPSVLPVSDCVFDISITPNRSDCACVIGVAREIAAITGQKIRKPQIRINETGQPIENLTGVTILDPVGCPRYSAGLIQNIEIGASPFWMRYRLYLAGVRSINNVVDVTNYVMLETGQPLHAFDYRRLKENRIVVRRADDGEVFTTLDGTTHNLNTEDLMICDGERAVALAGIMGGLNSEIIDGTRDVLIESAFFNPLTIRKGSKRLGMSTEASYRFERGADIDGTIYALKRAVSLISGLAGGETARDFIDNYPNPYVSPVIGLRIDKANRLLGMDISKDTMIGLLNALELEVNDAGENRLSVKPPSFRVDITREVDVIEEIARLNGYDKIPVTYPSIKPSEDIVNPLLVLRDRVRSAMAGFGFNEVITYAFISPDSADILDVSGESPLVSFVRLINPLSVDQSVMRTSLLPGLLATVKNNIASNEKALKLFEWGKIFIHNQNNQLPIEKTFLAAVINGLYQQKTWYSEERHVDFYDMKGVIEALLKELGLKGAVFSKEGGFPGYDPKLSSGIYYSGALIGQTGRVSPKAMEAYELKKDDTYIFELDIEQVLKIIPLKKSFKPFSKFPAVYRDISMIFERRVESADILGIIKREGGELIESVRIFDSYEGDKIAPSEKALAFSICYRSSQGTLDGAEVNQMHEAIIGRIVNETGGRLREG
ncbi:MAG: phenylalanine--tRNA ligase subunit beta [Deltaproteobacteria bacterium]|nr:phenylalanine--tRNA ligase subunit beta [Deltaproteobacteria bacterium]